MKLLQIKSLEYLMCNVSLIQSDMLITWFGREIEEQKMQKSKKKE